MAQNRSARFVALDWVNFLLADVREGLGAYVIVYLVTMANWSQATVGAVLTVSGLTGIIVHPFVGALIDDIRAKRGLLIAGTVVLSVCGLAVVWAPTFPVVLAADITMAVLGGVFAPVVAAITVGLCETDALAARLGRNAGAGMYDALLPLVLADMMRGAGRYSLARGVLSMIQGIGGSTGQGAAGFIVASFGYVARFLALSAIALAALLLIVFSMPETRPARRNPEEPVSRGIGVERR